MWEKGLEARQAERKLIELLQRAHAGELGASLAYEGHAQSVTDSVEKEELLRIRKDELDHRDAVGDMLRQLGASSSPARERLLWLIGATISKLCQVGGWFVPMYGAGRLESGNIVEYEQAARFAFASGHPEFVEKLLVMAEVEWDHECYFRGKVENHWGPSILFPLAPLADPASQGVHSNNVPAVRFGGSRLRNNAPRRTGSRRVTRLTHYRYKRSCSCTAR